MITPLWNASNVTPWFEVLAPRVVVRCGLLVENGTSKLGITAVRTEVRIARLLGELKRTGLAQLHRQGGMA